MRFGVLGPLAVWTAAGHPVTVPGAKVRALLADLLLQDGRAVSPDRLIDDLWGNEPLRNPAGALQVKVSQLRKALEDAEPGGRKLVVSGAAGYLLRVDENAVDATRFAALLARARATPDPRLKADLLTDALALWRGAALADLADEEFVRAGVASLEEQRLTAEEERAEARLAIGGEHGPLAAELGDLVTRHPLRERLRAAYMRALYGAGRQSEALETYAELRDRLRDELGLDPGPGIAALHQAILEQRPDLNAAPMQLAAAAPTAAAPTAGPATAGPPTESNSSPGPRTNLPAAFSELVGRDEAVAEVRALLDAGRLVTLIGPGGVGKTRLALESAARLVDEQPDGVWVVELAGLDGTSPSMDDVAEAVAAALGIRDDAAPGLPQASRPIEPSGRLAEALRDRALLLVLDNCEHVIDPVAHLSELLLRAAPGVRILATSQEPLGLAGEVVQAVPPLELPHSPAEAEPAALLRFSAVRLFVARATAASPGFELGGDNARAVAAICRRLDGVPLALELAATRVRALGVHELAERLDDRFRVLAAGRRRGGPARQQTLRAMIDWSWELLSEPERVVLRRLAVHLEGCTLEAAEEVCGEEDVLEVLARLVDRSMVVMADGGRGGPRYRLLESVSAYALERLAEAGEIDRVKLRHVHYYTALAERAEARLRGPEQRRWLQRLDAEHANLRGALDEAVRDGQADVALRLVNALAWYWFVRGRIGEGRRALERALSLGAEDTAGHALAEAWRTGLDLLGRRGSGAVEPIRAVPGSYDRIADPGSRARAEWFLSEVLLGAGEVSTSALLVGRALPVFRRLDDRWGEAAALATTANLALVSGDIAGLERAGSESLSVFRDLGERWGQARATELLGKHAEITGDHTRAADLLRNGLRLAEELGLRLQVSLLTSGLGRLALLAEDYAESERLHERGRSLAAEHGYKPGEAFALTGLALASRRAGRLDAAESYMRQALEWERQVSYAPGITLALAELGFVAELRGDADAARSLHQEGLAVARDNGDPRAVALALEGLAGAEALAGRPADAAALLAEAAALRESVGVPLPPAERGDVDRITKAIGD
ncbi:BTAD domain-containing putative transcriptional regulator [Actinomadura rudentiformis]|uniref:AAA family ATPase n=1 Tax=Actinomadura rudentiformis TaxID=359158 RepID=A0A6H9Z1J1_9ACTN|nr:BTAD domain-containing putative transcriptional regulator [Actinomadura rudentiformis]KAB2348418.1 AAA family ATPase [Actinomadura rudentiformis]